MIASLNGVITEKLDDKIIVDINGVGYGVFTSLEDYSKVNINETKKLYIYEYVREQAHDLFGFLEKAALNLFEMLIDVNGVGPKMALNMLSIGTLEDIKTAINEGNIKYLVQASGVGRRVAERVVVDLREKVGPISDLDASSFIGQSTKVTDEAQDALVALGFTSLDAHKALKNIDSKLPTEERVKQALKEVKV